MQRIEVIPQIATAVMESTAGLYQRGEYRPPWIGYLAVEEDVCVGTCAFKSPPQANQVEIAYITFPENEGRGVATRMAGELIAIARADHPGICLIAHTMPEPNASNAILKKLNFTFHGALNHPEDGPVWAWRRVC